ncbi:MAG: zinc-binding dehydrogenase [Rhizobiaceae bacterium]|nr:zinc-binding dehydrogenase [Rhizobiaceae bacterium]MCV0404945.1 zinc-binding dehydrogenase [Rhizobiaceae bacterium]
MKAGVAGENGLSIAEVERPAPGPEQVLVKVVAAGMNRADLNAARGAGVASKASLGRPIGMEWAGEVVELGTGVTGLAVGDRVMCSGSGGYAEYAVADMGRTMRLAASGPELERAAVLPLALMTADDALVTNGRMQQGDDVLVHGASSAVGLMTLQIARLKGARTIAATSGDAGRRARLAEFGATHPVDPNEAGWAESLAEQVGGDGIDVAVDMVSGAGIKALMKLAAVRGRIVNVGRLGGTKAEFDFDLHAAKRLNYIGVTFRTRSLAEIRAIAAKVRDDLWDDIAAGRLSLPIDRSFALDDALAAHEHMAANRHFGKIVLIP